MAQSTVAMTTATFPAVGYAEDCEYCEYPEDGEYAEAIEDCAKASPVEVVIRVRPPLDRELRGGVQPYAPATEVDASRKIITLSENLKAAANDGIDDGMYFHNTYRFGFDCVYGPDDTQKQVYERSARSAVINVLAGYNASIIAYGQTGSGKTYTMTGELEGEGRGIIPRAVDDVFGHIQRDQKGSFRCKFLVRASYLQIYNEVVSDLLKPEATNLTVREDPRHGVRVEGLSEWVVRTPADVYTLMARGAMARATGATKLNEISSRSHAIFVLIVEKSVIEDDDFTDPAMLDHQSALPSFGFDEGAGIRKRTPRQIVKVGKLYLVDLAGSERVHLTGATGKRLEESKKINQSLSALGNVISALTESSRGSGSGKSTKGKHIPYRDSRLTRILEDSLGGNCKTTFMAMISPAVEAFPESLSTLKFAHRAKKVKNLARVNEDVDHVTLLRKYERELRKLRAELQQRSKDLVDKRLVLQLEEARRREQADKIAAITALEKQSVEIARQKAAMAQLQKKIASMQSQLLIGGQKVEETPEFRTLLAAEQARIRQQYEVRLAELEAESQAVAADRAAAERLKSLLVKQRDVMVALTERLAERDRDVLALQAALEAAEGRAKKAEDGLDDKTAELIAVRKSQVTCTATYGNDYENDAGAENDDGNNGIINNGNDDADSSRDGTGPQEVDSVLVDFAEKQALKSILENKVAWLVKEIEKSVGELAGSAVEKHPRLAKQLDALASIISHTVEALE